MVKGETEKLNEFFKMLAVCEDKVTYGPKSVAKALENNAVETLLLSDKLFRAKNIEQRRFYVKMYEQAHRDGLEVVLFGATNAAAQRLNGLTGVAAILRYEMAEL
jgi:protein pelota